MDALAQAKRQDAAMIDAFQRLCDADGSSIQKVAQHMILSGITISPVTVRNLLQERSFATRSVRDEVARYLQQEHAMPDAV